MWWRLFRWGDGVGSWRHSQGLLPPKLRLVRVYECGEAAKSCFIYVQLCAVQHRLPYPVDLVSARRLSSRRKDTKMSLHITTYHPLEF